MMSKEKRFVQSQYVHHLRDTETDTHYYLTSEKIGCRDLFDEIEKLTEENRQLKKQNKVTSEFFVVRENDKIIALFTNEQRAKFYCRENLANLHYQKEEWIIKERVVRFDE